MIHILGLTLAIVAMTAERPPDRVNQILGYVMLGTAAADALSTEANINRGYGELNPLVAYGDQMAGRMATKAAATTAIYYITHKMHQAGHTRASKIIRIATIAVWGYAVAHNLRQ